MRSFGIRGCVRGMIATSLGLAASFVAKFKLEVFMGTNIALAGDINAICLVAGFGLLGSLASFLKRGEQGSFLA